MPSPAISTPAALGAASKNIADHVGSRVAISLTGILICGVIYGTLQKVFGGGYEIHSDDGSFLRVEICEHDLEFMSVIGPFGVPKFELVRKSRS